MTKKTLISSKQAIILIVLANIATAGLFVPTTPVTIANQDGWMPVILATFISALLVYYPIASMAKKYPGKTIIQYSPLIIGKVAGKLCGVLFMYYFFLTHCFALREFGELTMIFMTETPTQIPIIMISVITVYAVKSGIEVMGRCTEILFPLGLISFFIIGVISIRHFNFNNILPVMEAQILPLFRATLSPLDWLSVGFVFSMFTPFIRNSKTLIKIGVSAVLISGAILTIFSIINILVFGPDLLKILNYPLLILAMVSEVTPLERIEVFIILMLSTWVFIKAALFSFAAVLSLSQLFDFTDYKFLILPETLLSIAYSLLMYDSYVEMSYAFSTSQLYYLSFSLGLPLILWLISTIRPKI